MGRLIKLAIMTVGQTPSNFDPEYSGKIKKCDRTEINLPSTEESQLCCVFEDETDGMWYWVGLTINELNEVNKGSYVKDGVEFVWDERYKEISVSALSESNSEVAAANV